MSLSYRSKPFVRNNQTDSYEMVFDRVDLLQHLLDDYGIYIIGNPVDYAKGPYRAFRVHLLLVPEVHVPLCRLLCIPTFILKVEQYCRKVSSAIVTDISILNSVLSRPSSIASLSYLHVRFANRHLKKEKEAHRVAKKAFRDDDSDDDVTIGTLIKRRSFLSVSECGQLKKKTKDQRVAKKAFGDYDSDDDVTIATLIKRRTILSVSESGGEVSGASTSFDFISRDKLVSPSLKRKPLSLSAPRKKVLISEHHFLDASEDVLFEKHSGSSLYPFCFDFVFFC